MGYYINQKCWSCKKSLTHGYVHNYSGIGQPFVVCDRCGVVNNNSSRVTEWELKSQLSKTLFVLGHVFSAAIYYGFGSAVIGAILLAEKIITSIDGFAAIVGCGLVFGLSLLWFRLSRAIRASNVRMRDADYVAKLQLWGLTR